MATQSEQERITQLEHEISELKVQNQQLQDQSEAKQRRKPFAWRSLISNTFLIVGVLALVPAGMMVWLDRTVVQPDAYIASVGPVIQQPAVQKAIQQTATDQLFAQVDVNQVVAQALPDKAQFLVAPISAQVKTYTNTTIGKIVASPQFATAWVQANTRAQATFMNIANKNASSPDLDLSQVYTFITNSLKDTPLAPLADKPLPPKIGDIHVATVPALVRIPHFVSVLDTWRWVMVGLAVVLLAGAVAAAKNRRRTFVWVGFGIVGAVIITLAIVRITRGVMVANISGATYQQAAVAVWQTVLHPFFIQMIVTAILGIAVVITGWLLGPGRLAVSIRTGSEHTLANARLAIMPGADNTAFVKFVHQRHRELEWGLLGVTVILLVLLAPLTIPTVLSVLVVALILLLLVELLAAPAGEAGAHGTKNQSTG